jgi:hypothetical protein
MNDPTRGSAQPPGPPQPPADGEAATLRAYRDAAAQAGEAPRADTRAAILAAAARQVQARPQPVGRAAPLTRYRAPLALAASLLVGTIAWQLSAQFDEPAIGTDTVQEAPAAAPATSAPPPAPAAPAAEAAAVPSPSIARSEAAPGERVAEPRGDVPAAAVPPAVGAAERSVAQGALRPKATAPAVVSAPPGDHDMASKPARDEREAPPPSPSTPSSPPPSAPPTSAPPVAPAPAPAPAAADSAAPSPPAAVAPPAAAGANRAGTVTAPPALPPSGPMRFAPPPAASGVTAESQRAKTERPPAEEQVRIQPVERRRFAEDPAPRPLAAWIALVTELRAAGRDAEADRELQALRKHYPQAQIPAAALPAAER